MKVTVLVENTAPEGFSCEHGLSLFIEHEDKRILLDAGTTDMFYDNAKLLNIDFSTLDACVLSHGHYDHSGGFGAVFRENDKVSLYMLKSAIDKYYSGNGGMHEIGIPEDVLKYQNERFVLLDGKTRLFDNIYLIPHATSELQRIGEKSKLYKVNIDETTGAEEIVPDDFRHEQSLVFDTKEGLIIFNSCSHGGVGNIIAEVKRELDNKNVYAYIGGFHMKGKVDGKEVCAFTDEEVDKLCDDIRKEGVKYVYTGHCTGLPAFDKLKERLGSKVLPLTTGGTLLLK